MLIRTTDFRATLALIAVSAGLAALAFAGLAYGAERGTLAVLRGFPVHFTDRDESPEKRDARLAEVASAIDAVTENPVERAALLTLARHESGLASYVHENRCAEGPRGDKECDRGNSKGIFQLKPNANHPTIPDSTLEQADIALRLWRGGRASCARVVHDDLAAAFNFYGTGGSCAPSKWSKARADMTRRIAGRL